MSNRLLDRSPLARHPTPDDPVPVFIARQKKKDNEHISAQLVELGLLSQKHVSSRRHHTSRVDEVATGTGAAEAYPKKSWSAHFTYT